MPRRAALVNADGVAEHVIIMPDGGDWTPPHGYVAIPHEGVNLGDIHVGAGQFKRPGTIDPQGRTATELAGYAKGTYINIVRDGFQAQITAFADPVTFTLGEQTRLRMIELALDPPRSSTTWIEDSWQAELSPAELLEVTKQARDFIAVIDRRMKTIYDGIADGSITTGAQIDAIFQYNKDNTDRYVHNHNRYRTP